MKIQEPVYTISIAARLVGVQPRALRLYEELGLVTPRRRKAGHRIYSPEEVELLIFIRRLIETRRVNLAGIKLVLEITRHFNIELDSLLEIKMERR